MAEEKTGFVTLKSWADEESDVPAPKPEAPKTWGKVEPVKAASIAEQLQEAEAEQPSKSGPGPAFRTQGESRSREERPHHYESRSYERPSRSYEGGESREPRPKNPIPTSPPFTAFFGNLSYEVDEDAIYNYFGELGIKSVRIMMDHNTGRPKGFAYVEFETADGLEQALTANDMDFHGRRINIDVAAQKKDDRYGSGPSRRGFGDRGFGDRGFGDRSFGDRSFGSSGFGDRNGGRRDYNPPGERPKLELKPRSVESSAGDTSAKSSSSSDPFGGAKPIDQERMDQLAAERLKKEQEREERLRAERQAAEERRREEREGRSQAPRGGGSRSDRPAPQKSERESEIDASSSWRRKPGEEPKFVAKSGFGGSPRGGRGGYSESSSRGGRSGGRAWQEDADGFRAKESKGTPSGPKQATSVSSGNKNEGSSTNVFDALDKE